MLRKFAIGVLLFCVLTATPGVWAHSRITTEVTWGEHIRPIFAQKCMRCHRPGGSAPEYVDLTTYGTNTEPGARAWAVAIEEELLMKRMPPWQADDRFAPLDAHSRLSILEKDLIVAWIQGGAPQGEPRNLPVPEAFTKTQWAFGTPDIVLENNPPVVLDVQAASQTVNQTLPLPIEKNTYITGVEFLVDKPMFVRRITAWVEVSEDIEVTPLMMESELPYDPLMDTEDMLQTSLRPHPKGKQILAQWFKGETSLLFPEGAGRYLLKESIVTMEVVYERPDYAEEDTPTENRIQLGLFAAGETEVLDLLVESMELSTKDTTLKESITIFGLTPRAEQSGKDIEINIAYPDGQTRTLLFIPAYSPQRNEIYRLDPPVSAPAGSVVHMKGNSDALVGLNMDYTLKDHIYIEPVIIPRTVEAKKGTGMSLGMFSNLGKEGTEDSPVADVDSDIYWCPMRGNPCELDDYKEGESCKDCGMDVKLRASFFEGQSLAPAEYGWDLSKRGLRQTYWCPNRGDADHTLQDYPRTGTCEVCETALMHRAQFKATHTYVCMVPTCEEYQSIYYGPGLCAGCGQPVAGMGHMDHTPVHGGWQFFMADNLYHHLEGTMPAEGEFKLYLYDDWKTPLDSRNFKGALFIESEDAATGEYTETEYALEANKEGDTWLGVEIPKGFPMDFYVMIWLAGEEKRYDFSFDALTVAPTISDADQSGFRLHAHNCPPVEIPKTTEGIVREILKRDRAIAAHIDAKDWLNLHCPAADSKVLVEALMGMSKERSASDQVRLKKLIGMVNRSALALDYAGDIEDAARAHRAYEEYAEGMGVLRGVYPGVKP